MMRALYGEEAYPVQRVRSENQDGRTEKPKPKQKRDTGPPAKSKAKGKPNPKQKPGTHLPVKSTTNSSPPKQTSITKSSSSSGQNLSTTPGNQYTLPDDTIKKQVIDSFKTPLDKTWSGSNYEVHFKCGPPEADELWWKKGNNKVHMRKFRSGTVTQEWTFGGSPTVNIELRKFEDGVQIASTAVHGEEAYPVERVKSEIQDEGKGNGKPKPKQKSDTHSAVKSKGNGKPKPKQKSDTHSAAKSKGNGKTKPKQKSDTHSAAKSKANSPPLSQTSTYTSSSSSDQNLPTILGNQYTLPDDTIKRHVIGSVGKALNKIWYGANYEVHFIRGSPGGDQLYWRKGNDKVYMHKSPTGSLTQEWTFGELPKVKLEFRKFNDGSRKQIWDFHNTKLNHSNTYWKPTVRKWMNDKKDEGSLKKYADAIQSWCKENDFFFGKNSCVLFSLEELIDN
ncbi:hypothetical protein U1Q18_046437 [Sarracenia purpurea var. burkii]